MENITTSFYVFIFVYIVYLLLVVFSKKSEKKILKSFETLFIKYKYNVDFKKVNLKKYRHIIALTNSLILAISFGVMISVSKNILIQIVVAFPLLMILIYASYSTIGKLLKKHNA